MSYSFDGVLNPEIIKLQVMSWRGSEEEASVSFSSLCFLLTDIPSPSWHSLVSVEILKGRRLLEGRRLVLGAPCLESRGMTDL